MQNSNNNLKTQSISQLARMILQDWTNKHFSAVPYIEAMCDINNIDDKYGAEDGRGVVTYFLSNATHWRGETAKAVKAELKRRLKLKPGEIPLDEDFIAKVKPVIYRVWETIAYDCLQACRDCGEKPPSNLSAIEASLDADHPSTFCGAEGKAVQELMRQMDKFHGYDKVQRFLSKHIKLDTSI